MVVLVVVGLIVELLVDEVDVMGDVPSVVLAAVVLVINFFSLRAIVVLCH